MIAHRSSPRQTVLALCLLALVASCSKTPPAAAPRTVDLDNARAKPAPAAAQEVPKAVAAAQPNTPTVAAPVKAEPAPTPSVALHLSAGQSKAFALPELGRRSRVTVTPVDAAGQPYSDLGLALGARLLMVTMRTDGSWARLLRAEELNVPERHKHQFDLTFERAGAHVMVFAFQPEGAALATVPSYIEVKGDKSGDDTVLTDRQLVYQGERGLEVVLHVAESTRVCQPLIVGSSWRRHGRPVAVARADAEAPAVHYAALHMGLTTLVLGAPAAPALGAAAAPDRGDKGSRAVLRLPRAGRYRIIATNRSGKTQHTALFTVTAVGEAPPTGCPSAP